MIEIPQRTRDSVAILGFTEHNYQAPWGDPAWDFVGLNDLHSVLERHWPAIFTSGQVQWFQLHRKGADGQYPGARDPAHTQWLQTRKFPIWMWAHDPNIPTSVPYPLDAVLGQPMLPTGETLSPEQYWNNSISWMIAWAIWRGYKTIGLYGVDMAMDGVHGESEYQHQRPSVEYIIGVARGLGIRVVMPQESEICKCAYLYGWDNMTHSRKKLLTRYQGLVQSEAEAVDAYEQSKRAMFTIRGAIQVMNGEGASELGALMGKLPVEERKQALVNLQNEEQRWIQENENAKRSLHEVRGAKNNTEWFLRNYLPGDAPIQDVPRTQASVMLDPVASAPVPSDGQAPVTVDPGVNRVVELLK